MGAIADIIKGTAFERVWDDIVAVAEEFDDPARFTTFIAFEWTPLVDDNNLYRNVMFRDEVERASKVLPCSTTAPIECASCRSADRNNNL